MVTKVVHNDTNMFPVIKEINRKGENGLFIPIPAQISTQEVKEALSSILKLMIKSSVKGINHPPSIQLSNQSLDKKNAVENVLQKTHWYTARALSEKLGSNTKNPSMTPYRWKKQQRIFAIHKGGSDYYPDYEFDTLYQPLPIIKEIITLLDNRSPLELALWFGTPNATLNWALPQDSVTTEPDKVLLAAQNELTGPIHG